MGDFHRLEDAVHDHGGTQARCPDPGKASFPLDRCRALAWRRHSRFSRVVRTLSENRIRPSRLRDCAVRSADARGRPGRDSRSRRRNNSNLSSRLELPSPFFLPSSSVRNAILTGSFCPVASTFMCVPPTSMTKIFFPGFCHGCSLALRIRLNQIFLHRVAPAFRRALLAANARLKASATSNRLRRRPSFFPVRPNARTDDPRSFCASSISMQAAFRRAGSPVTAGSSSAARLASRFLSASAMRSSIVSSSRTS